LQQRYSKSAITSNIIIISQSDILIQVVQSAQEHEKSKTSESSKESIIFRNSRDRKRAATSSFDYFNEIDNWLILTLTERIKMNNQLILILIERNENSDWLSSAKRIKNSNQLTLIERIEKSDQLLLKEKIKKSNQSSLTEKSKNNNQLSLTERIENRRSFLLRDYNKASRRDERSE